MAAEIALFRVDDLNYLEAQPRQVEHIAQLATMNPVAMQCCMEGPWSFTGWAADGRALWCIGVYDGEIWGFLAKDLKRHMICLSRWGRAMLARHLCQVGPLRVDCTFPEAVRLAKVLGCRHIGGQHWVYDK